MPQGTTITLTPVAAPLSSVAGTHRRRHTAYDVVERLLSMMGGNSDRVVNRDIKRAIEDAYREFPTLHDWTYLETHGRLLLHGAQTDGTVSFDWTGGSYERLLTLTGATWPTWAAQGTIRVGEVLYEVEQRIDSTRLVLTENANPGADLTDSAYTLAQDTYLMPADFLAGDRFQTELWGGMYYTQPRSWMDETRHDAGNTGLPTRFTFMGDPRGSGALVLRINPNPDTDQTLDFVYHRRMRPIRVWDLTTGTATVTSSNTVVTLSGGTFDASMQGSVIRLSSGIKAPDGTDSLENYVLERNLIEILSSTTAQMDEAADQSLTAVAYRVSDPIDMEDEAMFNAFVFGARKHLAQARVRDDAEALAQQWLFQLRIAQEADSRYTGRQSASVGYFPMMPIIRRGPDVE